MCFPSTCSSYLKIELKIKGIERKHNTTTTKNFKKSTFCAEHNQKRRSMRAWEKFRCLQFSSSFTYARKSNNNKKNFTWCPVKWFDAHMANTTGHTSSGASCNSYWFPSSISQASSSSSYPAVVIFHVCFPHELEKEKPQQKYNKKEENASK